MNPGGGLAYGAAVIAAMLLGARDMQQAALYFHDHSPPQTYALGLAGWAVATFGPLILSISVWSVVKRVRARWMLHLLFIPGALALHQGGAALLLRASGMPGLNLALGSFLLWATLLLCLTIPVHAAALIVELFGILRRRTDAG